MKAIVDLSLLDFPKYATVKAHRNFNLLLLQEIYKLEDNFEQKEDPQDLELMFTDKFPETLKILGHTSFQDFIKTRATPVRCYSCGRLPNLEESDNHYWYRCDCGVWRLGHGVTIEEAITGWNLD